MNTDLHEVELALRTLASLLKKENSKNLYRWHRAAGWADVVRVVTHEFCRVKFKRSHPVKIKSDSIKID